MAFADAVAFVPRCLGNAKSGPTAAKRTVVPHSDWGKVQRVAQVHAAIYAATIAQPAGHPLSCARIPPVGRPASPATQVVLVWLIDRLTGPTPA